MGWVVIACDLPQQRIPNRTRLFAPMNMPQSLRRPFFGLSLGFSCLSLASAAAPQFCEAELVAANPSVQAQFGSTTAFSGSYAAVGSPTATVGASCDAGTVTLFELVAGTWEVAGTLTSPNVQCDASFGYDVDLDGNTAIVSAPFEDFGGLTNAGRAYVYVRTGSTWSLSQVLQDPVPAAGARFGHSVSVAAGSMAVSSIQSSVAGADAGAAHTLQFQGGTWVFEDLILPDAGLAGGFFGTSIAVFGGYCAVGAVYDDTVENQAGAVYMFERQPDASWTRYAKLTPPTAEAYDFYGITVSLEGEFLAVGAEGVENGAMNSGSAFVYRDLGFGAVILEAELTSPNPTVGGIFGRAVSYSAGRVVVAEFSAPGGGAAHVFERSASQPTWSYQTTFRAPGQVSTDAFGVDCAISADSVLVGALLRTTSLPLTGAAYVFPLDFVDCNANGQHDPCEIVADRALDLDLNGVLDACESVGMNPGCQTVANSTGFVSKLIGIGSSSLAANDIRLAGTDMPRLTFGYPIVSQTGASVLPPGAVGFRCVGGSVGRDFGNVFNTGLPGSALVSVDLTSIPQPNGAQPAAVGQTWHWQLWHRDAFGGSPTSTFSDSLLITITN
jgi:hypothetical protein